MACLELHAHRIELHCNCFLYLFICKDSEMYQSFQLAARDVPLLCTTSQAAPFHNTH